MDSLPACEAPLSHASEPRPRTGELLHEAGGARGCQQGRSRQNSGSPMSPYRTAGAQGLRGPPHLCFKLSSILRRRLPPPTVPWLHGDSERRHPPQLPHLATHPSRPALSTDAPAGGTRRRRAPSPESPLGQVGLGHIPPGTPQWHSDVACLPTKTLHWTHSVLWVIFVLKSCISLAEWLCESCKPTGFILN